MSLNGVCHCGEVKYTVKLEDKSHILCHCHACKTINGGDYTCNQVVPEDDLTISQGTLSKYTYTGDSGNPVHCFFCPTCSTHIYHRQTVLGSKIIIRTTPIEGAAEWPVSTEIYAKDAFKWQSAIADAKSVFDTTPPA